MVGVRVIVGVWVGARVRVGIRVIVAVRDGVGLGPSVAVLLGQAVMVLVGEPEDGAVSGAISTKVTVVGEFSGVGGDDGASDAVMPRFNVATREGVGSTGSVNCPQALRPNTTMLKANPKTSGPNFLQYLVKTDEPETVVSKGRVMRVL